jgi:hypothetical protein|tara:strand:+ start:1705 stop:2016 length:312 start_codon:yes stop_codon:yes gene_type:complete
MDNIYDKNQHIHIDRGSRKIVVTNQQDTTNILEQNKWSQNNQEQKGDLQRIAQIPLIALKIKTKERFGHSNWYKVAKEEQKKIIREMVNSNEYMFFRTGDKRL